MLNSTSRTTRGYLVESWCCPGLLVYDFLFSTYSKNYEGQQYLLNSMCGITQFVVCIPVTGRTLGIISNFSYKTRYLKLVYVYLFCLMCLMCLMMVLHSKNYSLLCVIRFIYVTMLSQSAIIEWRMWNGFAAFWTKDRQSLSIIVLRWVFSQKLE